MLSPAQTVLPSTQPCLAYHIRGALRFLCSGSAMLCLVLHAVAPDMYMSVCCSTGATCAVTAAAAKRKGLLVFCSPESPEVAELRKLPLELEVVAVGRTEAELSGETLRPVPLASVSTQCWTTSAANVYVTSESTLLPVHAQEHQIRLIRPAASSEHTCPPCRPVRAAVGQH